MVWGLVKTDCGIPTQFLIQWDLDRAQEFAFLSVADAAGAGTMLRIRNPTASESHA